MSKLIKGAAGLVAALALSSVAQAGCNNSYYCSSNTGTSTLAPLSTYFDGAQTTSYNTSSYTSGASYTMSASQASASYGSGSISSAYTGGDVQMYDYSGSSLPGLGINESLQSTNCPVDVYNPNGGTVLGCYNVVKPAPAPVANTTYYQVVRPVIYVRYPVPVPVAVPYYSSCGATVNYSRYGGYTHGYRGCR